MAEEKHQIVILGGGSAGLTVAARLRRKDPHLKVTVIDPASKHYYQPLWTLVGAGILPREWTERDQAAVIPKGVGWVKESVVALSPETKEVELSSGKKISYEMLVVAPGIQVNWSAIEGLTDTIGENGVCSNYSYAHVEKTWKFIREFKGGRALFTFPNTPVKCAGAPQKIMYLAEHHFRKAGVRDKSEVVFMSAAGAIFGVPHYAKSLTEIVRERGIETSFKQNLVAIRPKSREAIFRHTETGNETVSRYDLLHVSPPMSAPDFIKTSLLANEAGWVNVDKHSLQHIKYPEVFALGDASSLPTSKTGAAIRKQAPVLVENLLAVRDGKKPSAVYNGYTSCPLVTGYGKVIMAEFDYDGRPQETFPFDQSKERRSMYLLKRHLLPVLYWKGMLRGRA